MIENFFKSRLQRLTNTRPALVVLALPTTKICSVICYCKFYPGHIWLYISEIKRKNREGLGLIEEPYEFLKGDPAPLGMRTNDFLALFSFADKVTFQFAPQEIGYFLVVSNHSGMMGIVSGCLYDTIGTLNYIQEENHGREGEPLIKLRKRMK